MPLWFLGLVLIGLSVCGLLACLAIKGAWIASVGANYPPIPPEPQPPKDNP